MRSFLLAFLCAFAACLSVTSGFTPAINPAVRTATTAAARPAVTSLNVFGKKKSAEVIAAEEEKAEKFWQGEWVCKDCGYIYNRVRICRWKHSEQQKSVKKAC